MTTKTAKIKNCSIICVMHRYRVSVLLSNATFLIFAVLVGWRP